MSRFFVLPREGVGPGGDIYFRKNKGNSNWYDLYLDSIKIGQVMNQSYRNGRSWAGLSFAQESKWFNIRMIEGFATRMDAATFIIKHNGYWMRNEEDEQESLKRGEKFLFNLKMEKAYNIMKGIDLN